MKPVDDLPPALPSLWRVLKRGYHAEPFLLPVSFALTLIAALPDALMALWLKLLADGVLGNKRGLIIGAASGLAVSAVGTWFLRVVSDRVQRHFRDRLGVALESLVVRLQASVATIEHQERPEYLDRLSVLRDQVFMLDHMYMSLFGTCGWILRLVVTICLLISIHPALVLLAVFAVPPILVSTWRPGVERAAEEKNASHNRLARHLFDLATTAPPGKEVRVTGIENLLVQRRRSAWEQWYRPIAKARWQSAVWHMLAWAVFGFACVGSVVFVSATLRAAPGSVLLVLAAAARLSSYIGATVTELGFLRGVWLIGSRRLAWLEDYAASKAEHANAPVPIRLQNGVRFDHVSFSYPGTTRRVLEDINLDLPAGAVVAIVGENGAGKSTLVKLLCRMYPPDQGKILIDGVDLAAMPAKDWRLRLAGAFQDFFRFEFKAQHSVGVGDLPRRDEPAAALAAIQNAGAEDVLERLPQHLDTQLGPTWPNGVDISFGQWQKFALARGFMREQPLLLILDEPTAALDAETEHALFERYAAATRNVQHGNRVAGQIVILVSHRFSTVRMADLIVVLDGARVVETGSHEALMGKGGLYAELYNIQAKAYRT